jgi:hypothetical protein
MYFDRKNNFFSKLIFLEYLTNKPKILIFLMNIDSKTSAGNFENFEKNFGPKISKSRYKPV